MARWARTIIRFRWAVLAVWLVAVIAGGTASSGLSSLLTNQFILPGSDSKKASDILQKHFGQRPEGSFSLVVKGAPGSAGSLAPQVRSAAMRAAQQLPTGKVAAVSSVSREV